MAHRTRKLGIEHVLFARVHFNGHCSLFGQSQCCFKTFSNALAQCIAGRRLGFVANFEAIDHHIDVVLLGFFERGQIFHFKSFAIDAKTHITQRLHLLKNFFKLAFAFARNGRHDHEARVFGQLQNGVDHLTHGLRLQRQVVVGAIGRACARKQQAQVVVNLGHGAHRRARVVAGGFLFDGNGGRQTFNQIDIGLVHQLQKLAGIGRQAFDITALAFGIQGVKGQARFAGTAQASDDHQLVARDIEVDVFKVVGAGPAHADVRLAQGAGQIGAILGAVVCRDPCFVSRRCQSSF